MPHFAFTLLVLPLLAFPIQTLYFVIIKVNMFPILAEQAIIAHTLLPIPHKGSKPIRAKGGTNTILVSFEFNLPHTSCCLS